MLARGVGAVVLDIAVLMVLMTMTHRSAHGHFKGCHC